jgi:hypothetical protein
LPSGKARFNLLPMVRPGLQRAVFGHPTGPRRPRPRAQTRRALQREGRDQESQHRGEPG